MSTKSLSNSVTTDMSNNVSMVIFDTEDTNFNDYTPEWSKWNGYYKKCSELKAVIDKKAMWTVGKGFKSSAEVEAQLAVWKGNGKDTANDIFENMCKVGDICGDFFAEIVRNVKDGSISNLKPLNPGTMTIRSDDYGIIIKYIQNANKTSEKEFSPDEIFHLQFNRIGDNNHGTSSIEAVENIILALNEAKTDLKTVFHRYVKPLIVMSVDTDDTAEILAIKAKLDKSVENMENMIIPKGTVEKIERVSIPQFSTLDPMPWIKHLISEFIRAEGTPDVILGMGQDTTEATSKILYLAFQQLIEHNQNFVERQLQAQLGIKLEFEFPASLEPLLFDQMKKEKGTGNFEMGLPATK